MSGEADWNDVIREGDRNTQLQQAYIVLVCNSVISYKIIMFSRLFQSSVVLCMQAYAPSYLCRLLMLAKTKKKKF